MRRLVWAAAGFAAAAFLAEYALPVRGLPLFAAALVLMSLAAIPLRGSRRRAVLLLTLSAAAGALWWLGYYTLRVAPGEALAGQDVTVTARVTDYPLVTEEYSRVTVRIVSGAPREKAYLYLYDEEMPELTPGDIVTGEIRVRSVMERDGKRAHTQTAAGRNLAGYFRGVPEVTGRSQLAWLCFPQRLARYVKTVCRDLFPEDVSPFMTALLTGDKEDLYADVPLYEGMRSAGMLHAAAVSGMHILVLVTFLRLFLGRGKRTTLAAIPVMAVFVVMSGCGASAVRAAVMEAILLAAPLFDREEDGPTELAAALLLLLLINPMSIGGTGLQLSFACMAGFTVFMPGLVRAMERRRLLRRFPLRFVARSAACTLCATVFSVPVAAYHFGTVPLLSPLANLLALPVVELCFGGGYLICALSAVAPGLAAAGAALLTWGVRWCSLVCRTIGAFPYACLYVSDGGGVLWLCFVYVLFGAWLLLRYRKVRITALLPAGAAVLGLMAVFLYAQLELSLGRREMAVLDVGQGQSVVFLDDSASVVVDCGGSKLQNAGDIAADWLSAAGKRHVDLLILTHLHQDHTNGVETLLYRMDVDTLILPAEGMEEDEMLPVVLDAAERAGTDVLMLSEPGTVRVGVLELTLLLPRGDETENEMGIVVRADLPDRSALIMGDAGIPSENVMLAEGWTWDTDILVAGHHGSNSASGPVFLRAEAADTAVVSVGSNPYGLPTEPVMARLTEYCGAVLRTDRDGTVILDMKADD